MASLAELLRELHQLLSELSDAKDEIKRLPLQLKAREAEVVKAGQNVQNGRDALKKLKVEADQKELGLKSAEQRIRDLKGKLNSCQSNKEYTALQDEIKKIETSNGTLEEEILLAFTATEEKAEQNKLLDVAKKTAETELAKFKEMADYRLAKMTDRVVELDARIKTLEGQFDPQTLADYRRVQKLRGANAIAGCDNRSCQSCFTEVTPQTWADLSAGKAVKCHSCSVFLYKV